MNVVRGVCLGAWGGFLGTGCERVFKGQAAIIQMVFYKKGCSSVGGAERGGGLSGLWMKTCTRLRAHVLKSEDGNVLRRGLGVVKGMPKGIQIGAVDRGAAEISLQESRARCSHGRGRQLGEWSGDSPMWSQGGQGRGVAGREILSARKSGGKGGLHWRSMCIHLAERCQGPSHCPPLPASVAQRPET